MNNRTTFTIVRHGESEANRVMWVQGYGDCADLVVHDVDGVEKSAARRPVHVIL